MDYEKVVNIALVAGKRILEVYNSDFGVSEKSDKSPVTIADLEANEIIVNSLAPSFLPILSEEGNSVSYDERMLWDEFWLVDPLDGTKEFIKKNGEFTVNIALIRKGVPVFGVVYAPVLQQLYIGGKDIGAFRILLPPDGGFSLEMLNDKNRIPQKQPKKFTVLASRSHLSNDTASFIDELREKHGQIDIISMGSSLKLCLIAEGSANIYPRQAPTMEWDTAAGHAICLAAGKRVYCLETKKDLVYNKQNLLNPFFVAV